MVNDGAGKIGKKKRPRGKSNKMRREFKLKFFVLLLPKVITDFATYDKRF